MKNLKKKLNKTGGFTLVEMLIVVAIIAILIAVSIPLVSNALEQARDNTDLANERAAKAEASMVFLGVGKIYTGDETNGEFTAEYTYTPGQKIDLYYDAVSGKLLASGRNIKAYGQCTKSHTGEVENGTLFATDDGPHKDNGVIGISIATDGLITLNWGEGLTESERDEANAGTYAEWKDADNTPSNLKDFAAKYPDAQNAIGAALRSNPNANIDAAFLENYIPKDTIGVITDWVLLYPESAMKMLYGSGPENTTSRGLVVTALKKLDISKIKSLESIFGDIEKTLDDDGFETLWGSCSSYFGDTNKDALKKTMKASGFNSLTT